MKKQTIMTDNTMDNTEFKQNLERLGDAKQARIRNGLSWVLHLFTLPPVVSLVYGAKTNYWVPTLAATGVAAVTLPFSLIDYGITFAVAPPITSAVLLQTKSQEKRRKLGIVGPEEADIIVKELS